MRRNEAHNLIPRDQIDENAMEEERVARIETDIANIQLDIREFLKGRSHVLTIVKVIHWF